MPNRDKVKENVRWEVCKCVEQVKAEEWKSEKIENIWIN